MLLAPSVKSFSQSVATMIPSKAEASADEYVLLIPGASVSPMILAVTPDFFSSEAIDAACDKLEFDLTLANIATLRVAIVGSSLLKIDTKAVLLSW